MRTHARSLAAALLAAALVLAAAGCGSDDSSDAKSSTTTSTTAATGSDGTRTTSDTLDPERDYGDTYADGILPVGDGKYTTDAPKQGSVYLCRTPGGQAGGAQQRGPWFVNDDTEYDLNQKVHVSGDVHWEASWSMQIDGDTRVIATNDLPRDHTTGDFPVQSTDPAYQYDRNPNHIEAQSLTYRVPASPTVASDPSCVSGEVGVMETGIALFDAFDDGGRDAGAWEVQDHCDGHPQITSEYHYHTLSSCIADTSVSTVIGFALDGFPITGPKVADGSILTTADLDECHGITSAVTLDGKQTTTYHYVMTQDFPYSASCFRGTPVQPPRG